MIDFISDLFSVGQTIYLTQSNDVEIGGKIVKLNDHFIVIESEDGNVIGVRDEAIRSFSKEPVKSLSTPQASTHSESYPSMKSEQGSWKRELPFGKGASVDSPKINRRSFRQYKPGDKIPIESLAKRDPSLATTWRRSEEDRQRLRALREKVQSVFNEIMSEGEDLDQEVPAIGAIVDLKPSYQFGFIDDVETGERYFYNRGDIVDTNTITSNPLPFKSSSTALYGVNSS